MGSGRVGRGVGASLLLSLLLTLRPALAAPPAPLLHETYIFPGGDLTFSDWNGDGALDAVLRHPTFAAAPHVGTEPPPLVQVWFARPDAQARFGLRPDLEIRPPEGAFAIFYATPRRDRDAAGPPAASSDPRSRPVSILAADPDGLLAPAPDASGAWTRVVALPLLTPVATAPLPAPRVTLVDLHAELPDLDGDGWSDIPLLDRDGAWRIVWGAADPRDLACSEPLATVALDRSTFASQAPAPAFLIGATWYGDRGDGRPHRPANPLSAGGRTTTWSWREMAEPVLPPAPPSAAPSFDLAAQRLRAPLGSDRFVASGPRAGRPAELRLGPLLLRATAPRTFLPVDASTADDPAPPPDQPQPGDLPPDLADTYEDRLQELLVAARRTLDDGGDLVTSGLVDVNGDGIPDVWIAHGVSDPVRPRTVIRVYPGRADGTLPDLRSPFTTLRAKAPFAFPEFADLDGDGALDTWLFELDAELASPADQLKMYLQVGVRGRLTIYLWDRATGLSARRAHSLPMDVRYEVYQNALPSLGRIAPRADLDGDGVRDVGLQLSRRTYAVWRFDPRRGFDRDPMLRLETAHPITSVRATDLDGRPGDDLILTTADPEDPGAAATVVVLPRPR